MYHPGPRSPDGLEAPSGESAPGSSFQLLIPLRIVSSEEIHIVSSTTLFPRWLKTKN